VVEEEEGDFISAGKKKLKKRPGEGKGKGRAQPMRIGIPSIFLITQAKSSEIEREREREREVPARASLPCTTVCFDGYNSSRVKGGFMAETVLYSTVVLR
jgi:hypothetical protein